ncbi:FAD:protein FMN transferase [Mucilaginibacter lutimaris]|uniref:FAD:protein FMN transferase n=1 Tax=Mucilaginibacter lutimaris TaxID=931629 RepID=A0ABW2ZJG6_9SPHI
MLAVKNLTGASTIISREARLIGNRFEISVVATNTISALERIDSAFAEISRIEKLLSAFPEDSILNQINRNAGIEPVRVDAEVFRLIDRAMQISALTYGTFDITYATASTISLDYSADAGTVAVKPLKKRISSTNYTNIVLDQSAQTVFLKNKGMRIGFGAVSRGYAADRAKYILQMEGVSSGVINAGGDLLTWGLQPDNTPWTIAAAEPLLANQPYAHINISDMAVVTSYNTDKHTSHKRSADINPANGFPISKIKSVSIITPTAEMANAMANPVTAMGINSGLYLINKLNQIACIIVDDQARVYTSKDINTMM